MLHSTQTENESSHVVLGMHSTSTTRISRWKGQFCAKGQVPNLQILFAWQLTRPFLKTAQLGCPTSTVRNPRSTRAAVSQQKLRRAGALHYPRGRWRQRAQHGENAQREPPPWSRFVEAYVTSAKLPLSRPAPDAAVT